MGMVRHQINGQHFVVLVLHHSGDVTLYFFPEMGLDQAGTVFYSKNQVNVELGIGVWFQGVWFWSQKQIKIRTKIKKELLF